MIVKPSDLGYKLAPQHRAKIGEVCKTCQRRPAWVTGEPEDGNDAWVYSSAGRRWVKVGGLCRVCAALKLNEKD